MAQLRQMPWRKLSPSVQKSLVAAVMTRDRSTKLSGLVSAVASMSPGDADALESVAGLLGAVTATQGATSAVKDSLVATVSDIVLPWAAPEMRSLVLQNLMDYHEEAFATGSSAPGDSLGSSGSMSPPHIGPEDSVVINSLTFDCVSALFSGAPTLTFHNILHISPSPPRPQKAEPVASAGALPHPEELPAWVGQVVRNDNVAARFNRKQLIRVCKGVRSEIQAFESDFLAKNGRRPNPGADRSAIAEKYENYRALKKFVRANAACKIQATYRGHLGRLVGQRLKEQARVQAPPAWDVTAPLQGALAGRPMETQRAVPLHTSGDKGGRSAAGATHSQQPSEEPEAETVQGYLVAAQRRLAEEQKRVGRPSEMSKMTASELEEEKSFIKYELKRFDDLLGAQLGRSLKKADKEPMRPLYSRYHEIKNVLSNMVPNPAGTSTTQPAPVEEYTQDLHILQDTSNKAAMAPASKSIPEPRAPAADADTRPSERYHQLKQEKRALQQKLHQYESEFFRKHGRKMKHHEDIAPVQHEYTEYKRLKGVLASMEAQGLVA